jgi:hypothetical protein
MSTTRKLSEAGRRAISEAAKRRWRAYHALKAGRKSPARAKSTRSAPISNGLIEQIIREEVRTRLDRVLPA